MLYVCVQKYTHIIHIILRIWLHLAVDRECLAHRHGTWTWVWALAWVWGLGLVMVMLMGLHMGVGMVMHIGMGMGLGNSGGRGHGVGQWEMGGAQENHASQKVGGRLSEGLAEAQIWQRCKKHM